MDTLLNIVVVEDHHALRELTVDALLSKGHHVVGIESAEELPELSGMPFDLMVIDLNLPGEDGISLARRIRHAQPGIGIIMLTAKIQIADRMAGYESGADIYLSKPISLEELSVAIQAVSRRIKPKYIETIALKLDEQQCTLTGPLQLISLTRLESTLLVSFIRANNQKLENWQLMELITTSEKDYSKANLEVMITRLRKKMVKAGSNPHPVLSIRDFGYQLNEQIQLL
jgi:DNA-binding response OmpR family regulator